MSRMELELQTDSFVLDGPLATGGPAMKMAAKRYRPGCSCERGFTLLLAHGSGFHKELWEPTLNALFRLQNHDPSSHVIREVWAFDWQAHGDSAILNADELKHREEAITLADWAMAIVTFLKTPHVSGHRLIAIGHSAGSSTFMYTTKLLEPGVVPYLGIILVEPPLIDKETFYAHLERQKKALRIARKAVSARRDVWPSREDAFQWFSKRFPWNTWDARVLQLFCSFGLRPASDDSAPGAVVTKCAKSEEAKNYDDVEHTFEATEQIEKVCHDIPIHVVFGEILDLTHVFSVPTSSPYLTHALCPPHRPSYGQASMIDKSKGRDVASVVRIPGAGHMIVQQKPEELASVLINILHGLRARVSKL
ncbi:hypothetical protein POSPLDRAFT_104277 [Postia placenta Mad-698-R]|uniref:AB hydrolase-1 domain-containing protein n=1 Tax=Postia placenta MAD-698-R-SB12 TaxID=670580 RepID=A0A1X6MYU2_9APHY|nr:hypothetical protein POSPLADRAFT_1046860 [Postia placenta MAD-698-R-SB12]EED83404.1 hypothetical protein POSPLDRAFT_104277 [Postia placenta Mad-698-R]OSX61525.1 hypothetical protein POSPLADRAFT_1046860 [Postia placenta MAD-698-R-SB12]